MTLDDVVAAVQALAPHLQNLVVISEAGFIGVMFGLGYLAGSWT